MIWGIEAKDLSVSVLLALTVMMILTGVILPRWVYKQKADESERWRLAFETEREARATSDAQTSALLEGQKASLKMITSIFENSEKLLKAGGRYENDVAS